MPRLEAEMGLRGGRPWAGEEDETFEDIVGLSKSTFESATFLLFRWKKLGNKASLKRWRSLDVWRLRPTSSVEDLCEVRVLIPHCKILSCPGP